MSNDISILRGDETLIEELIPLFDAYRVFYDQTSDPAAVRDFLSRRLDRGESTIFLARIGETAAGFTQLYPLFSSVAMQRLWLLNDLFVDPRFRKSGVGGALLKAAEEFAKLSGAVRIELATGTENHSAQRLYQRMGWQRNDVYFHYIKNL